MIEIQGKFITLVCSFLEIYKTEIKKLDDQIRQKTGKGFGELDPDGWYNLELFDLAIESYRNASASKDLAYTTVGRYIYPTLKSVGAIPDHILESPLSLVKFEAEGFNMSWRGDGIIPREFLKAVEGEVVVKAITPGSADKLMEGVYLGILNMCKVSNPKVERLGDSTFRITWND